MVIRIIVLMKKLGMSWAMLDLNGHMAVSRQGYIIGSDIHLLNLHSVFVRILSKDGHSRLNDICKNSRFEKKIYPTKFNSTYIKNSTADDNSNNSGSG